MCGGPRSLVAGVTDCCEGSLVGAENQPHALLTVTASSPPSL